MRPGTLTASGSTVLGSSGSDALTVNAAANFAHGLSVAGGLAITSGALTASGAGTFAGFYLFLSYFGVLCILVPWVSGAQSPFLLTLPACPATAQAR